LLTEETILSAVLADSEVELNGDDQTRLEARVNELTEGLKPLESMGGVIDGRAFPENMTLSEANVAVAALVAIGGEAAITTLSAGELAALAAAAESAAAVLIEVAPILSTVALQGDSSPPMPRGDIRVPMLEAVSKLVSAAALERLKELARRHTDIEVIKFVPREIPQPPPQPSGPRLPAGLLIAGVVATGAATAALLNVCFSDEKSEGSPNERFDGTETTDGEDGAEAEAQLGFARTAEEVEKDGYLTKPPGPDERRPIPIESDVDLPTNALSAEASGKHGKLEGERSQKSKQNAEVDEEYGLKRGTVVFDKTISPQKQKRHLKGTAPDEKSYLDSFDDAQTVLDAYNSGEYEFIKENTKENTVWIRVTGVSGQYVNVGNPNGLPDLNLPTNNFMIQSSKSPKVVPVNPEL